MCVEPLGVMVRGTKVGSWRQHVACVVRVRASEAQPEGRDKWEKGRDETLFVCASVFSSAEWA